MKPFQPSDFEAKWHAMWTETSLYQAIDNDPRQKYYYLFEFPYPSGDGLHVGHLRPYVALDVMARHKRMEGYNVLFPMGWDAFGLPTENFAIKHKIAPQQATEKNVATFKRQVQMMGVSVDWCREINTTDPSYYKWTQWIFLRLLQKGLAYQAELPINWCPFEKTGLANEEVVNGIHERCGTPVEKKLLKQWVLKITAYADRLIDDLKEVDYLDRISSQQINWIGRSTGAEIDFALTGLNVETNLTVYTTRLDTLYGATFLVVSPELAQSWIENGWKASPEVGKYIAASLNEQDLTRQERVEKTGIDTGITATHPLSGETLPVWVADYVLGGYGTGAIMACPAHDQRDYDFATKFELPIRVVIEPVTGTPADNEEFRRSIVAIVRDPETGKLLSINWGTSGGNLFVGGGRDEGEDAEACARREVAEETGYTNLKLVASSETIHHHYYAHSKQKQRIIEVQGFYYELQSDERDEPQLEADEAGKFTVEWLAESEAERRVKDALHALLFERFVQGKIYKGHGILTNSHGLDGKTSAEAIEIMAARLGETGSGRLATKYKLRDWIFSRQHYWGEPIPVVHCDTDGIVPVPQDQLPITLPEVEFYEPTETGESPLAAMTDWVHTTCPKCGGPAKRETDTMPNWAGSSWYFLRYMDPANTEAFADMEKLNYWGPVDLYNGGMEHTTLHLLYSRFWHKFLYDEGLVPTPEPYAKRRSHGMILGPDGRKMSKSVGNVINPDHVVAKYGADTLRLYEMFMGPFDEVTNWSEERLSGVSRFVWRVWTLINDLIIAGTTTSESDLYDNDPGAFTVATDRMLHKTLKKVHEDIDAMHFNTAVSAMMELVNYLTKAETKQRLTQVNTADLRERTIRIVLLMMAPFTPYMAEELWRELGEEGSIHAAPWPRFDPELIKDDVVGIAVQVNGKLRGTVMVEADANESVTVEVAKADAKVADYLNAGQIVKTIYVPRKLVNFVVK